MITEADNAIKEAVLRHLKEAIEGLRRSIKKALILLLKLLPRMANVATNLVSRCF